MRPMVLALLVSRVVDPVSKLATHRMLSGETAFHSLDQVLGLSDVPVEEVYVALDWLGRHQETIDRVLARKLLSGAPLVRYDLSSTWLTGRCCPLAAHGYRRDSTRDDLQITFGLICTAEGCPIAVEVFPGNCADPATVASQVSKLKERYGIEQVTWVADRGMLTSARIEEVLKAQGTEWVSSLRAPQIAQLSNERGPFQASLFDQRGLIEVTSERFPGERLVVCRNPWLAEERARKREELLAASERELTRIAQAT